MELKVGTICDRGLNPRRPVNQDRAVARTDLGLFAVFDGVGGHQAGEVASQTAAETVSETFASNLSSTGPDDLVKKAVHFANRDLIELSRSHPEYRDMATTIALTHIDNARATIAHVGDSRVYRFEDNRLYRETVDHTEINDRVRAGLLTQQEADLEPDNHVINRALGMEPDAGVEVKSVPLRAGVRFLLCTDGIYRHLADDQIARILADNEDPQKAADELRRLVYERGATDNLTALVVQVGNSEGSRSERRTRSQQRQANLSKSSRIQVAFDDRPASGADPLFEDSAQAYGSHVSKSTKLIWVLVVLTAVAGAFYAGLQASQLAHKAADERSDTAGMTGAGSSSELVRGGKDSFERGDYKSALTSLQSALGKEPQNANAHYWLGRTQLEEGQFKKSASSFETAVALDPAMHDAYVQAAAAYQTLGNGRRARELLRRYREVRLNEGSAASSDGRQGPR